ncbi:sulfurtransferase TusA family protein [Novispirillum itersonii]|uniref:sulfurtransferase TusA family protein n=1 Tax=Novispirillum itersonii TaxID=189 RepID=UPI0003735D40|nr:sulfurtransferase TusA family protein [Novispirillum itersonii]
MTSDKTVISVQPPGSEEPQLLDARDLACPLPLLLLRRVLLAQPAGGRVRLWATAEGTRRDLAGFCRDQGFRWLETTERAEGPVFLIERL